MRDYGKIPSRFWIDDLGRKIRTLNMEAKLIAPYLMTCTHSTMIGVYYLPITLIAHELGITLEGTIKGLHSLFEVGYCTYDERSEYIWVHDMALSQVLSQADTSLKPNDNRVKSINETYQMLPELPFLKGFYDKYHHIFHLVKARENTSSSEGASKSLPSQKQEQEQEQKQNIKKEKQAKEKNLTLENSILEIFHFWQKILNHPNSKLDDKRKRFIREALRDFTTEQLCEAIQGCALTPHNMGDNERGERYDGLHVIFRDCDNIERFINNYHNPPVKKNISKNDFVSTQNRRLSNENFADKQYTQTPVEDIGWLNKN